MKEFLQKLSERHDLTEEEASSAMSSIMDGLVADSQIAAFLLALKMKGETVTELYSFTKIMRERSVKIVADDPHTIDMCGTGGDNTGTFNISTVASFIAAGAGVTVAKHGNRSVSSSCGSADVLKALGVNIDIPPAEVQECINKHGMGFLFAPMFHPAMKHAAKARADLGMKTCFNMLGPLTNPAGVKRQLIGTFSSQAAAIMARVLSRLDTVKAFVVHSHDGLDEVSLESPTDVHDVEYRAVSRTFTIEPGEFSLPMVSRSSIAGSTPELNAKIAMDVLAGMHTPYRHVALANAALGLIAAGKTERLGEAVYLATESVDSGNALRKLEQLREFTSQ